MPKMMNKTELRTLRLVCTGSLSSSCRTEFRTMSRESQIQRMKYPVTLQIKNGSFSQALLPCNILSLATRELSDHS